MRSFMANTEIKHHCCFYLLAKLRRKIVIRTIEKYAAQNPLTKRKLQNEINSHKQKMKAILSLSSMSFFN